MGLVAPKVRDKIAALAADPSPDVKLQVAIAARKVEKIDALGTLLDVLQQAGDDKLTPHIVWQNLHPLLEAESDKLLARVASKGLDRNLAALMPRVMDRLLVSTKIEAATAVDLVQTLVDKDRDSAGQALMLLATKVQTGELRGSRLAGLKSTLLPLLRKKLEGQATDPLYREAALLAATIKEPSGVAPARQFFLAREGSDQGRVAALEALIAGEDTGIQELVSSVFGEPKAYSAAFRARVATTLGRLDAPWVGLLLLERYAGMEDPVQRAAIEVLTQRPIWSKTLLRQIGEKKIAASALNATQARKLLSSKDAELVELVKKNWGTVRDDRNPEREQVVSQMRKLLQEKRGDAALGKAVFTKNCAVCHKIYGEGQDVGPDITVNGRSDFEQLLSNVFDPNLVIGSGYLATNVTTTGGQVFSGLVVEDSPQRIVLKVQGGEVKTIARGDIDTAKQTKVSLMPEQLEKQMTPEEIRDLFAFLTLDRPPGDAKAKLIPGTPR
jgi:putative heme-binding domain-containing protein